MYVSFCFTLYICVEFFCLLFSVCSLFNFYQFILFITSDTITPWLFFFLSFLLWPFFLFGSYFFIPFSIMFLFFLYFFFFFLSFLFHKPTPTVHVFVSFCFKKQKKWSTFSLKRKCLNDDIWLCIWWIFCMYIFMKIDKDTREMLYAEKLLILFFTPPMVQISVFWG